MAMTRTCNSDHNTQYTASIRSLQLMCNHDMSLHTLTVQFRSNTHAAMTIAENTVTTLAPVLVL